MRRSKHAQAPGQLQECRTHTSSGKQSGWFLGTYQTEDRLWSYVLEVEQRRLGLQDERIQLADSRIVLRMLSTDGSSYRVLHRDVSRKADLRRLVRVIRSTRESDRLIAAHDLSNCLMKNCFVFGIVGDFHASIRRRIYSNEGLAPYLSVAEGVER